MKFDVTDPSHQDYGVYLDGEIQPNAIEADDDIGRVKLEYKRSIPFMGGRKEYETKYGKVHIVRMEGYSRHDYRATHLLNTSEPESAD